MSFIIVSGSTSYKGKVYTTTKKVVMITTTTKKVMKVEEEIPMLIGFDTPPVKKSFNNWRRGSTMIDLDTPKK